MASSQRRPDVDLDLAADLAGHGDAGIGIAGELGQAAADDLDPGAAAADLDDLADRLVLRDQGAAARRTRGAGVRAVVGRRKAVEIHRVGHASAPSSAGRAAVLEQ